MASVEVSIAAAVAVVGFNLLNNSPHRQSSRRRSLRSVALAGSAAAGDTEISVLVNATEIARIFNSATGFPTRDHLKRVMRGIPANSELAAVVVDAPSTNPINLLLEISER